MHELGGVEWARPTAPVNDVDMAYPLVLEAMRRVLAGLAKAWLCVATDESALLVDDVNVIF